MRSVFGPRGMILIWAVLTATIGLALQLKQLAAEIRAAQPERAISELFNRINSIPPKVIDAFFDAVHFDPAAVVVTVSGISIQVIHVMIVFGVILLVVVFLFLRRAIRSEALADDFVMLLVSYLAFQIVVGIWARMYSAAQSLRPGAVCVLLIATVAILTWGSGAREDSRIFWRGAFEIYLVVLFFFPAPAVSFVAGLLEVLATFGATLQSSAGFVAWSGVGMMIALYLLYGVGSKSRRSTGEVIEDLRKKINEDLDKAKK